MSRASLRVCASCEWIFKLPAPDGCPKCKFGHYGAHYVYGARAYRYARTQEPWYQKKMDDYSDKLRAEIQAAQPPARISLDSLRGRLRVEMAPK